MNRGISEPVGTVLLYKPSKMKEIFGFFRLLVLQALEGKIRNRFLSASIADFLTKVFLDYVENNHMRYVHGELVLQNGWILSAYFNGVVIYEPSDSEKLAKRKNADVFVPIEPLNVKKLESVVEKYIDKDFDFANIVQKLIVKTLKFGTVVSEEEIYKKLKEYYNTADKVSMGELIARVYSECGIPLTDNPEFFTLDDVEKCGKFKKLGGGLI